MEKFIALWREGHDEGFEILDDLRSAEISFMLLTKNCDTVRLFKAEMIDEFPRNPVQLSFVPCQDSFTASDQDSSPGILDGTSNSTSHLFHHALHHDSCFRTPHNGVFPSR